MRFFWLFTIKIGRIKLLLALLFRHIICVNTLWQCRPYCATKKKQPETPEGLHTFSCFFMSAFNLNYSLWVKHKAIGATPPSLAIKKHCIVCDTLLYMYHAWASGFLCSSQEQHLAYMLLKLQLAPYLRTLQLTLQIASIPKLLMTDCY